MKKSILLLTILFALLVMISLSSCRNCKVFEKLAKAPNSCPELMSQQDERHYIIELPEGVLNDDFFAKIENGNLEDTLRKAMGKLLELDAPVKDNLAKACMCRMVLMEIEVDSIKASDRVANAKTKTKPKDGGIIKDVGANFIFQVGPSNNLGQVKSSKGSFLNQLEKNFGAKVAIIDSGIDDKHTGLINNILLNTNEYRGVDRKDDDENCIVDDSIGYNFATYNLEEIDTKDKLGHGTHVSGIVINNFSKNETINREINNSIGLMNLKIIEREQASLFSAICAIHYAIDKEVDVINASWGYYANFKSALLEEAICRANEAKIFIVAAAGNDSVNIDECLHWPASFSRCYDNVITVAALNSTGDRIANFSNYGAETVNLAALGTRIYSTFPRENDYYKKLSGTSMAAPMVSRYIAELKIKGKSFEEVKSELNDLPTTRLLNFSEKPMRKMVKLPSEY